MKGQPLELACRGGSLLISESRVMRRGTTVWAVWRSQITGAGCAYPAGDSATVYLHLHDGRRFAAEEIAPHECFRLIELLGYDPEPETDAGGERGDAPLVIDFGDGHTRATASAHSVTLSQDEAPLWTVPRHQLLGVRVKAGATAATVQIMARGGGATTLEQVSFAVALRLLVALGAAPAEIVPLAPPEAPAPTPVSAATPAGETSAAAPAPPAAIATGETAQRSPRPADVTSRPAPGREPANSPDGKPKAAASLAAIAGARQSAPPVSRATSPSPQQGKPSSDRPSTVAPPAAARPAAIARPSGLGAPGTADAQRRQAQPPTASVAAASAGAATALTRPQAPAQRRPPAPAAGAAAIETERQAPRDDAPEGAHAALVAADRLGTGRIAEHADASTSENGFPRDDAITVRQAAMLLWHAMLAAVALRLAGVGHILTRALHRVGAFRLPRGIWARERMLTPARAMVRARRVPRWAATPHAWRVRVVRMARAFRLPLGTRTAATGARIGAAIHSSSRTTHDRLAPLPVRELLARVRSPSLPMPAPGRETVRRRPSAQPHGELWALPRSAAARWRWIALVVALGALVLMVAGDALTGDPLPGVARRSAQHGQPAHAPPARGTIPSKSPTDVIYVGSQDGTIYALDAATGTLLWTHDTGSQVEGGPAVADGVIYAGEGDGWVVALRADTQRVLWRYHTGGTVRAAPAVVDGVVYAGSSDHHLYALRASDGALLWRFAAGDWFANTPVVAGNMVYAGSYDGTLYALRAGDGAEVWHLTTPGAMVVAPMVVNGMVYAGSSDNTLFALDARTGVVRWRYSTGGSIYAAPMVANGVVYAGSCDTNVYALRASDGTLLWHTPAGGLVLAPAIADGQTVYVGTADGTLDALRVRDGTLRWSRATNAGSAVAPAVAHGAVYVGSGDASIFALDAQTGSVRWSYRTNGRIVSSPTVVAAS